MSVYLSGKTLVTELTPDECRAVLIQIKGKWMYSMKTKKFDTALRSAQGKLERGAAEQEVSDDLSR